MSLDPDAVICVRGESLLIIIYLICNLKYLSFQVKFHCDGSSPLEVTGTAKSRNKKLQTWLRFCSNVVPRFRFYTKLFSNTF